MAVYPVTLEYPVTPSRVCGLKRGYHGPAGCVQRRHTLTGVWIETPSWMDLADNRRRHTLTGVWIETQSNRERQPMAARVTPSRVCGLKLRVYAVDVAG